MLIKFARNDKGSPAGKLADAELHFTEGPLAGFKMLGFAIWERRGGGGYSVTFPARSYSVNGASRSFVLLRSIGGDDGANERLRDQMLQAYAQFVEEVAVGA